ncbi:MAG: hypothetical protein LBN43_05505 [Oscillospiraceae bacterium]|jgi:hypothetical protein|nr:hypothetical protein [Oscillospiraceae bacterium]
MKRRSLVLLLALVMIAGLFGACQPTATTETSPTPTPASATASAAPSANTGDDNSSNTGDDVGGDGNPAHNLAAGNYETDDYGVPLEEYTYELPLTTAGETYTYYTSEVMAGEFDVTTYGQSNPYYAFLQEKTGLVFDFIIVTQGYPGAGPRWDDLAIRLASDDIPDISTNIDWYYPGMIQTAFEEGFFTNLYPYKEYFPNYWRMANAHPDDLNLLATIEPLPEVIQTFWCLEWEPVNLHRITTRGDYLERLGLINDDVITLDQLHDALLRYRVELDVENPFYLISTIDSHGIFVAYDIPTGIDLTSPATPYINKQGKIAFGNSDENAKAFLSDLLVWKDEGLFNDDWMTSLANDAIHLIDQGCATTGMVPTEAKQYEYAGNATADPNAHWVPLHIPVQYEGQVLHLGDQRSWVEWGSWWIGGKAEDIPLLASYCDYLYSDEGIFDQNYGIEGETFNFNEKGEPVLSDFIQNHPYGLSFAVMTYMACELYDGGVSMRNRSYAFPGGERFKAFHEYWGDPNYYQYDGSMQWPSAVTFTPEEQTELNTYTADMTTYLQEQYLQFVDGTKPLTEWDSYVSGLETLGWYRAIDVYQQAYDRFIENYG